MKNTTYNCVVVGSGLSAWSSINMLIKKRIKPIVIDIGGKVSTQKDIKLLKKKLPFGYFTSQKKLSRLKNLTGQSNTELLASVGFGGLSKLWGGSINKLHKNEFKSYPFKYKELDDYYQFVDKLFEQFGTNDNLSKEYKLKYLVNKKKINLNYFNSLDLQNKKDFVLGQSRVAIKNNIVFSVDNLLKDLIKKNKIKYINNFEVKQFSELSNEIIVSSLNNKKIKCKKLYLACGPLETSKIILNSCKHIKKIQINQTKLIPSLWFSKRNIKFKHDNNYSDLIFNKISKPFFSSQIYFIKNKIIYKFKNLSLIKYFFIKKFLKLFQNRLFFFLTYLDQDYSDKIILKRNQEKISIEKVIRKNNFYNKVSKLIKIYFKNQIFQVFKVDKKNFGYGYHVGSCFPMSYSNNGNRSDKIGRIRGLRNIHIVDSSTLTRIPTSTITYTVMANAARIVDLTAKKVYKTK
jgi:hypothetical protein